MRLLAAFRLRFTAPTLRTFRACGSGATGTTGAGGGSSAAAGAGARTQPAPQTVEYWHPWVAGAQLDTQTALLQRYQQLHPGAAEERVGAYEPEALVETDQPVPGPFAAGAYLEKYGPHGRYDWPLLLERLRVPWLAILGGADPSPLVQAAVEAVRVRPRTPPGCGVRGVPHWRHGLELPDEDVPAASAQLVAGWWERLGP